MKASIFFIISMLLHIAALGQETDAVADTVKAPAKFFSGVSVTADIGKPGLAQIAGFEDKLAFSAHLEFMGYLQLSAEYGRATMVPEEPFQNVAYRVEGDYIGLGVDYVTQIKTKNFLSVGIRRMTGNYSDLGTVTIESNSMLSDDYQRTFARNDLSANWWEFVVSSETKLIEDFTGKRDEMNTIHKVLDNFYFGLHFRLRFALDYVAQEGIDTYTIPGYGRTFDNSVPAVNLYLRYRLGF